LDLLRIDIIKRPLLVAVAVSMVVLAPTMVIVVPAVAGNKASAVSSREVAHCMLKRMMADRTESYHDALRTCREQLESAQRDGAPETAMNQSNVPKK
jgi:hypothetical protein